MTTQIGVALLQGLTKNIRIDGMSGPAFRRGSTFNQSYIWVWESKRDLPESGKEAKVLVQLQQIEQEDGSLWLQVSYEILVQKYVEKAGWYTDYRFQVQVSGRRFNPSELFIERWVDPEVQKAAFLAQGFLPQVDQTLVARRLVQTQEN